MPPQKTLIFKFLPHIKNIYLSFSLIYLQTFSPWSSGVDGATRQCQSKKYLSFKRKISGIPSTYNGNTIYGLQDCVRLVKDIISNYNYYVHFILFKESILVGFPVAKTPQGHVQCFPLLKELFKMILLVNIVNKIVHCSIFQRI